MHILTLCTKEKSNKKEKVIIIVHLNKKNKNKTKGRDRMCHPIEHPTHIQSLMTLSPNPTQFLALKMQTHNPPPQLTNTYQHYVENFQQQIIAQQDNSLQVYN